MGAVVGVQSQISSAGALSVRARQGGLTAADVERARVEERSVIRAWAMRGTLHTIATEDYGWLVGLLGPGAVAASARRRADLGLDEEVYARALAATVELIADRGPLGRGELAAGLEARGIDVSGQRAPHLIGRASLEGVLCHGPDVKGKPTVALLADWAPNVVVGGDREAALAELALRVPARVRAGGAARPGGVVGAAAEGRAGGVREDRRPAGGGRGGRAAGVASRRRAN